VELPFAFGDVVVWSPGPSALRARLTRDAQTGEVSLWLADGAGAPVGRVGSLRLRAASAQNVQRGAAEELYRVEWQAAQLAEAAAPVAVLGASDLCAEAASYATREELLTRVAADGGVVVDVRSWVASNVLDAGDVAQQAQATTQAVLELLQWWLEQPELAEAALCVVTRGAVAVSDDEPVDVTQTPVWGLLRAAQSAHPECRLRLLDVDESEATRAVLACAGRR
jgi:hypothetical protein